MRQHLATALCHLRPPEPHDGGAIYKNYASDPEVTRYMLWKAHASEETVEKFLCDTIRGIENQSEWAWCITEPSADECIGMVSVIPQGHKGEIGYVLGRRFWGRGIMTEAVSAVINYCFAEAGLRRVWATCAVSNVASARVLEKVGMDCEGILRGWHVFPNYSDELQDCYVFSRLATAT